MDKKKSLLERFEIPIHHLDFDYINKCNNGREMEKIVQILRSGEEGYFPDLTKCAEDKLKELKPNSRLFRFEERVLSREALPSNEWKPIYDWNHDIKSKDSLLQNLSENVNDEELPPVREFGIIGKNNENENRKLAKEKENNSKKCERIGSTDYNKWDKFDVDAELLRLELNEERAEEEVEIQNRINMKKCKPPPKPPKISELVQQIDKEKEKLEKLTDFEKEKLSEEYRLHGNDYFRAKEFDSALTEYTKAIQIYPEKAALAYNNRALTYIKLQKYYESIKDSEECLKLEPNNIKARLRLAEANYANGQRRGSYNLYLKVLELDPENAIALKATKQLREIYQDIPPPDATRLTIQENSGNKETKETAADDKNINKSVVLKKEKKEEPKPKPKPKPIDYDFAELVKPNHIVKNRMLKAAEDFGKLQAKAQSDKANPEPKDHELLLPFNYNSSKIGKTLIQEIP